MRHGGHRYLFICMLLLVAACGDKSPPTISSPQISTTAISSTSISISWNKAADTRSDTATLVYKIYLSAPNPAYKSFDSIEKVEAGTLAGTLTDASSATISSGISAGSAYYINIVVLDEKGNKALYAPLGEYFHVNQIADYPFNGNGNDATATANHLVVVPGRALPAVTLDRFRHTNSAYSFNPATPQCLQSTTTVGITGNASRTVSLWVQSANTPAGTSRAPFAWGDGNASGSTFGVFESGVGNNWTVWLFGSANVSTATTVTQSWEHWVIGYNSTLNLVYTYKNGVAVNNGTTPAVVANTTPSLLYVGCGMDAAVLGYFYQGQVDDIRIFDQLLGGTDVANLYAVTRP